jgi:uncharacterized protein (DUF1697 family)
MASVVFLRAVNLGGRNVFRPAALARALAHLDVANVGAAGTFVVRKAVGNATLRAEVLRSLPFEAEIMICAARELIDLVDTEPFPRASSDKSVRRFVSVLAKQPRTLPRLPLIRPEGDAWQVRLVGVEGPFALCLWRRGRGTMLYPNEVVEKVLGVRATTRSWNTIAAARALLTSRS